MGLLTQLKLEVAPDAKEDLRDLFGVDEVVVVDQERVGRAVAYETSEVPEDSSPFAL